MRVICGGLPIAAIRDPSQVSGDKKRKRQHAVCWRVIRIAWNSLLQDRDCGLTFDRGQSPKMRQRPRNKVPCIEIFDRSRFGTCSLSRQEFWFDCRRDTRRYFILKSKYVGQLSVVSFRPDVAACKCVYELTGNTDSRATLADASFKDVTYAKFASQVLHVYSFPFIGECRIAGDNETPPQPR